MRIFSDMAGLYAGGFLAWSALGMTGATNTPVWSPKQEKDK